MKILSVFKNNPKIKILAIALAVLLCTAALFGVSLGLKDKKTDITRIGKQNAEIGDISFLNDDFIIGTSSTSAENRIYALNTKSGEEKWSFSLQSYVRKIKVFDGFIAVALENNYILFLNGNGEKISESKFIYPVIDLDYNEQNKTLAVVGSVSQATNAVFVINNFDEQKDYGETEYTYHVSSSVYPIGVAVTSNGVFYAGGNSKVYSCSSSGKATCVLDTRYTQNSFFAVDDYFILGYVNGKIDVYQKDKQTSKYQLSESFSLGKKEVLLSKQLNGTTFCAAEKGGKIAFYSLESLKEVSKGDGVTLLTKISLSGDGNAAMLKNNSLYFVDKSYVSTAKAFSIIFIPAVILFTLALIWVGYCAIRLIPKHGNAVEQYVVQLGKDVWKDKKCYLLLLPAFSFLALFVFWPILQGFIIAFQDYVPGVRAEWIGLENFAGVFKNEYFWGSMKNMVILLVTDLLKALIPPFIIAECIIALMSKRSQYAARVLMYIPGILPGLAGTLIWTSGILGSEGVLSQVLSGIGLEKFTNFNWLGDSSTALGGLILIGFPWVGSYIILYGALMSVPGEYYDAAKLDGFNWIQRILFIDLPMIRPQLKYIFVLSFIGSIQDFQRVYMTTGGSFGTNIPALEIYYNINTFNNYGAAAAMGLLLFLIILIPTLFNLRIKSED